MERPNRRRLLHGAAHLGLAAAGLPLLTGCNRAPHESSAGLVPRIGYLSDGDPGFVLQWPPYQSFLAGLGGRGWLEGRTIAIEHRHSWPKPDRLPGLAAELVAPPVDLIVAAGIPATQAARRVTTTVPLVMIAGAYDPVAEGLAASLARPGGAVAGMTAAQPDFHAKSLELFQAMAPGLSRLAVPWDVGRDGPYQTTGAGHG